MSDLVEMLQAASRDDRLADGMLYRKAADHIEELEQLVLGQAATIQARGERIEELEAEVRELDECLNWETSPHPWLTREKD